MAKNKTQQQPPKDYLHIAYKGKEYLWLAFTIISLVLAIYNLIMRENDYAMYFTVMTLLAGLFYAFYKSRRKKYKIYLDGKEGKTSN